MSLGKIVKKITVDKRYDTWYMLFLYLPTYVTYVKILANVHDHVQQFYVNWWTLSVPENANLFSSYKINITTKFK